MRRAITLALAVMTGLCLLSAAALAEQPAIKVACDAIGKAVTEWSVRSYDEAPSVNYRGIKGYRVLLCNEARKLAFEQQAVSTAHNRIPAEMIKDDFVELILLPASDGAPNSAAGKLPWNIYEFQHYVRPVCMGDGLGFRWFVKTTPALQHVLRTQLALGGGDDPIKLQMDALEVDDENNFTRSCVASAMIEIGDRALPSLEKVISKCSGNTMWFAVQALGAIRTPKTTAYLQKLYRAGTEEQSKAAAYALIGGPYREAAKADYLDMLSKGMCVAATAGACAEFKVKEALPLIEKAMAKPESWYQYQQLFTSFRKIKDKPIPQEITEASSTIRSSLPGAPEVDAATDLLSRHEDGEAAAMAAMEIAHFVTKGPSGAGDDVREIGINIFRSLPAQYTGPILAALKNAKRTPYDGMDPFFGPYREKTKPERKED